MRSRKSPDERFWRAIEIAAGGTLQTDIDDVGRYVASRGDIAVAEFVAELNAAVTALRNAGVTEALRSETTTSDGRPFAALSADEEGHCLEALIVVGRRWFEILLKHPDKESGPGTLPSIDLVQAVERARTEPGIASRPLWQERSGDRRRDGSLWIELSQGLGVGVPDQNSWPWTVTGVIERFTKAAVLRAFDESWRHWRSTSGIRNLDVWVEYWRSEDQPERVAITKRGRTTSLTVYRDFNHFMASTDPVGTAELEAERVFHEIRASLS